MSFLSRCRLPSRWHRCRGGAASGASLQSSNEIPIGTANASSESTHHHTSALRILCQTRSPLWCGTGVRWMSCVGANDCAIVMAVESVNEINLSTYYPRHPPRSMQLQILGTKTLRGRRLSSSFEGNTKQHVRKYLNMKECKSVEVATEMAFKSLDDLDAGNLSSFWTRISQLIAPRGQGREMAREITVPQLKQLIHELKSIFSKTLGIMNTFNSRHLTQTCLGLAKIVNEVNYSQHRSIHHRILHGILVGQDAKHKEKIFLPISNASLPLLNKFDARSLSNLAYANAIAGSNTKLEDGSTLLGHIAERSIPLLGKFNAQDLSNMVWAYEKIGESNAQLFGEVANVIVALEHLGDFKPQGLSNILLAFAKAAQPSTPLFKKVADQIVSLGNLHSFKPQGLSNTVWAFATAEESNSKLFNKVADHIITLDNLHSFKPQELSNTAWAFATAEESNPKLFNKVADHIIALHNLNSFTPQGLSNTVWAFATAKRLNSKLFNKVADHIIALDNLHSFKPQELSNILWAFATAEESNPKLFMKVADHIIRLRNLNSFKPQNLSNTVWAFANTKGSSPKLFKKVADHIIALHNLNSFNPQTISNIIWSFASADQSNSKLFEKVADHIVALDNLHSFNAQICSNILWGYATADMAHPRLFAKLAAHANIAHVEDESLDWKSRLNMLGAYEKAEKVLARSRHNPEKAQEKEPEISLEKKE